MEQVRIARDASDGKGDYTIKFKKDMLKDDVIWDEAAHFAKFAPKPINDQKKAKK